MVFDRDKLRKKRVDILEELRRRRMRDIRDYSIETGKGIPKWKTIGWSTERSAVMIENAIQQAKGIPTRLRVKTLKSGQKRYYIDTYGDLRLGRQRRKR
jgi:hypothetical protein